jgi:hypothetical protein
MANQGESGSYFVVDLGKVKLPPLTEKQVEAEIQAVVLRALASDFGGQPQARISIPVPPIPVRVPLPGEPWGLYPWDQPPIFLGSGDSNRLTVRDHTLIMSALMEHPLQVLRHLPDRYKSRTSGRPSGKEVLHAAMQVNQINDYVKERIRAVLDLLPKIEERQAALPESLKQAVDGLRQQLSNKSVQEKGSLLRDVGVRNRHREDGLAEGMEIAAQILEHGQDSIYSPDHSFYKLLQEGQGSSRISLSDIADQDGIGAAAGAAIGSVAPGIGTTAGGVAGGAGASGAALAGAIWEAIFGD